MNITRSDRRFRQLLISQEHIINVLSLQLAVEHGRHDAGRLEFLMRSSEIELDRSQNSQLDSKKFEAASIAEAFREGLIRQDVAKNTSTRARP